MLFAGMFVVGAALFHTGLAQKIGIGIVKISGTKESSLMFGIMVVSAALSSCLSNTGTAACLMPVVLGICAAEDSCFPPADAFSLCGRHRRCYYDGWHTA